MALEVIGVRAVIQNLNGYLSGMRQMESSNTSLARSQLNLEIQSLVSSQRLADALARVNLARSRVIRLTNSENASEARILAAKEALGRAQIKLANITEVEALRQQRALEGIATTQGKVAAAALKMSAAVGIAVVALTALVTVLSISAAAKFETQMTKINNLTEATDAQTKEFSKTILELSKSFPQSPAELGAGAYFILSSGIKNVAEAEEILRDSAIASANGLGTVDDIAKVLTATINAYGKENIKSAKASDILLAAIVEGRAEASEFATGIGRLLPIGAALGIKFDELAASVAGLTNVGLPTAQAMTAILGIMNQLFSPSAAAKEALLEVGTSIEQLRVIVREKGFIQALKEMLAMFGNNQQALEKLLPEVRGLNGALGLLRGGAAKADEIVNKVSNSQGIQAAAFQKTSKTFAFQANLLKNSLNRALIQLGLSILPQVSKSLSELNQWWIKNGEGITNVFIKGLQFSVGWLGSFVSATLTAVNALGLLRTAVTNIPSISFSLKDGVTIRSGTPSGDSSKNKSPEYQMRLAEIQGFGAHNLPDIAAEFNDVALAADEAGDAADKAAEKLKDVAQEFLSTSEAAGNIEDAAVALGLFGNVTQEIATAFGLSASGAGAVQGFDAVVRSAERADAKAFNLAKTLSTVAVAFQEAAAVGQRIVRDLARSALEASRNAASALFGRPTRELARLGLQGAQSDLALLQAQAVIEPQIKILEDQLKSLNGVMKDQIDNISSSIESVRDSQKDQVEAIDDQIEALKDAEEERVDVIKQSIEDLRRQTEDARALRDLLTEELAALGELIEFEDLKDNLGLGELSGGEEAAVAAIIERLEEEKRALDRSIPAMLSNVDALEAQEKAQKDATEAQIEALNDQKEAIDDATDAQVKSLETQRQAIEDSTAAQEANIQGQIDGLQSQLQVYEDQSAAIQHQIELLEANHDIMERNLELADKTLLTEEELRLKVEELTGYIAEESGLVRDLSAALGEDVIPEMDIAREAFAAVSEAARILADESIRAKFIPDIDYAAVRAGILAAAMWEAAEAATGAAGALGAAANNANGAAGNVYRLGNSAKEISRLFESSLLAHARATGDAALEGRLASDLEALEQSLGIGHAQGGIFFREHTARFAEGNKPEAILPLTNVPRAREIVATLPPSLAAAIFNRQSGESRGGVSVAVETMNVADVRKDTGPVADLAYTLSRAVRARGISI